MASVDMDLELQHQTPILKEKKNAIWVKLQHQIPILKEKKMQSGLLS